VLEAVRHSSLIVDELGAASLAQAEGPVEGRNVAREATVDDTRASIAGNVRDTGDGGAIDAAGSEGVEGNSATTARLDIGLDVNALPCLRATHARPTVNTASSVTVAAVGGRTNLEITLGLRAGTLAGGNADTIAGDETVSAAEAAGVAGNAKGDRMVRESASLFARSGVNQGSEEGSDDWCAEELNSRYKPGVE